MSEFPRPLSFSDEIDKARAEVRQQKQRSDKITTEKEALREAAQIELNELLEDVRKLPTLLQEAEAPSSRLFIDLGPPVGYQHLESRGLQEAGCAWQLQHNLALTADGELVAMATSHRHAETQTVSVLNGPNRMWDVEQDAGIQANETYLSVQYEISGPTIGERGTDLALEPDTFDERTHESDSKLWVRYHDSDHTICTPLRTVVTRSIAVLLET